MRQQYKNQNMMTQDYTYTNDLNKEQWAWEFLRRNSEYQKDYSVFIHRWKALEKDYGKVSDDNVKRWKNDPRSLANEWDSELYYQESIANLDRDNTTQEPIRIDAWMGLKWGFDSFPLNPDTQAPNTPQNLHWRDQEIDLDDIRFDAQDNAPIAQINFDLRFSLQDQLDAAQKELIALTSQLQRLRKVKLVVKDHHQEWQAQLALLDDKKTFNLYSEEEQKLAIEMTQTGYRKILLMRG